MRSKFRSAPALLSILSLLLLTSAANVDDPSGPERASGRERSDGQDGSYRTLKSTQIVPNVDSPKDYTEELLTMTSDDPLVERTRRPVNQRCSLNNDTLQLLKFSNDSEWRINQMGLRNVLDNDPQALIQCTKPGDRVVFELTGTRKFNRTLAVPHKLEFISRAPKTDKNNEELTSVATFNCPDSDAFLRINSSDFTASGFIVENCTRKNANSTVVIYSGSEVSFNNFRFRNNKARAIYTQTRVKLTLKNSEFTNNGDEVYNGGAIYASPGSQLEIHNSLYEGNTAKCFGGAFCFRKNCSVTSVGSTFSDNRALKGGAIFVQTNSSVNIEKSMFYKNNASFGGVLYFHEENTLTMRTSNFTNNHAEETAAVVALMDNNNATIEEVKFSNNTAPGASVMLLSNHNRVTIISSFLKGNHAMSYGSAVYLYEHSILYIKNSNLSDNKGAWYGGALGANVFSNITIIDSSFIENSARWGGALYIESNANVSMSNCRFSKNNANRGGAVRVGMDSRMTIRHSTFEHNNATNGGCFFMDSSKIEVQGSIFTSNNAQELGGCFLADSSSIIVNKSILSQNKAKEGGGIHISTRTFLQMEETIVSSNSANGSAGGLALMYDSRLLCFLCQFVSNTAKRGGGLYIQSHTKQLVVARLQNSTFESNNASSYGGGMVVETLETKRVNCDEPLAPCSKVLLFGTDFTNNRANVSGSAILATTPSNVLVDCNAKIEHDSSVFISRDILLGLQAHGTNKTDPKNLCPSWQGNSLPPNALGDVIGTFGHHFALKTVSSDGPQIIGNYTSGFTLQNVRSAEKFPRINITTIDAFGNTPAPTLFEDDALQMVSENGFLKDDITFSFKNMSCVVSSITASASKGNYTIKIIPKDEDVLEPSNLTIFITDCGINEELKQDTNVCQDCRNGSYNFNHSKIEGCTPCPEHAKCDGIFLLVEEGYWQRSPCHDRVKKCIDKKACSYPNRTENITTFVQNYTNCSFTNKSLEEYGTIQCRKGYKGPLCGVCKESYGHSANLECVKCRPTLFSMLRVLLILIWLSVTTTITIRGTLPIASRCLARTVAMTPLLEDVNTIPFEEGASAQVEEETQGRSNYPQVTTNDEQQVSSNISSQLAHDVKIATGTLIETWKTLLNFLQVISSASIMDLELTNRIAGFFKTLNVLGSATLNAISGPIDCVLASYSVKVRIILMHVIRMFVPVLVIAMLSIYWYYRFFVKYRAERLYLWRRFVLTMITVIYITYFDIAQVAVRAFNCVDVYDNINPFSNLSRRLWVANTSIECYKGTHVILVGAAVVSMIVSIGFPLVCARALLKNRNEVNVGNSRAHEMLGLLCGPFKDQFVYWECITMIKKALLAIIMVFSRTLSGQAPSILISIVIVFFLALHSVCFPFKKEFNILNYYEIGSLMTSGITYILVQFFNNETSETDKNLVFVALVVLVGVFIILMTLNIARSLIAVAKASLKSHGIIRMHDKISWFETIKLYSVSWWFGRFSSARN